MLKLISEVPSDKRIAGVHCVPVLNNGNMIMVWDREEQGLTTIGGRLEGNESVEEGLDREVIEEAGLILSNERKPFACWYWENTDTYTIWFLVKVQEFVEIVRI